MTQTHTHKSKMQKKKKKKNLQKTVSKARYLQNGSRPLSPTQTAVTYQSPLGNSPSESHPTRFPHGSRSRVSFPLWREFRAPHRRRRLEFRPFPLKQEKRVSEVKKLVKCGSLDFRESPIGGIYAILG